MKKTRFIQLFMTLAAVAASGLATQAWADSGAQMREALDKAKENYTEVYALTFTVNTYQAADKDGATILELVEASNNNGLYLMCPGTDVPNFFVYLSSDDNNARGYNSSTDRKTTKLSGSSDGMTNTYSITLSGKQFSQYGVFSQGQNRSGYAAITGATYTVAYDGKNTTIMMESTDGVTNKIVLSNAQIALSGISIGSTLKDNGNYAMSNGSTPTLTNVYTWNGTGDSASWNAANWKLAAADGQNYANGYDVEFSNAGAATATVDAATTVGRITAKVTQAIAIASGKTLTLNNGTIEAANGAVLTLDNEGSSDAMAFTGGTFTFNGGSATTLDGTNILSAGTTLAVSGNGGTMTITNGSLGKGAKFSLSGSSSYILEGAFTVDADPVSASGVPVENGFASSTYSATVVEGSATNEADWTVNGLEATYSNGVVSATGYDYQTYYVVRGEATASGIKTAAEGHEDEFKTVELSAGNLVLDATLTPAKLHVTGGSIAMNSGTAEGTVDLAAGTTLGITGDDGSLTFTGGSLGDGAKLSFSGAATYTLSGSYEVEGGTGGGGGIVIPTSNGFATGDFSAKVVEGNATNNASWKLNGMTAAYNNGTITASGTLYDTYYIVQSGSTVSVSSITQAAGSHASELKTIALNKGTLSLNADITNQVLIAQDGTTVDAGTSAVTRAISDFELASGASVVLEGGGSGSTSSAVATINVGTLSVDSGNSTLVVNGKTDNDDYMNVLLKVGETIVGDSAKLTVKGQSGKQDNTLGAITLGKGAILELAGHRSSGTQSNRRRFEMAVNGGTMGDGSLILLSLNDVKGKDTNADYTLSGTFYVTSSNAGTATLPTGNGFATANISAEVLRNNTTDSTKVTVYNNEATWYLNGKKATYSNGTISVTGAPVYKTWYQKSGTTSITEIMTAAGDGASLVSTVELSGGELTVDGDIATVNATGGTVYVASKEYKIDSLNVNDDTTVAGEVDSSVVGIASGKTASFTERLQAQGVEYASAPIGGVQVQVTNNGKETQTYDISKQDMSVTAYTLTKVATEDVKDMNKFQVSSIINQAGGTLWLAGMTQQETIEVNELTIGNTSTVKITEGVADQAQELTIKVKETLSVGNDSTLLANLVMESGSTLNLGGGQLTLGSDLQFGSNILLDAATMENMDSLAVGQTYNFITPAKGTEITGNFDGKWFGQIFSRESAAVEGGTPYELKGDYMVQYNSTTGQVGFYKTSDVPEPATATLSLLALMALAARRRRK